MAYVYQHRRLDTNEVFYVGIAKIKTRPLCFKHRNIHWLRIVKKHGFEVDILIEGCSWKEACKIEKGLIFDIGRKDLNLGPLVNMTDGGEGGTGIILSKQSKDKISFANVGKKNGKKNQHIAKKVSEKLKLVKVIPVDQYCLEQKLIRSFYSVQEAYRHTVIATSRSEERSVGKRCSSRW